MIRKKCYMIGLVFALLLFMNNAHSVQAEQETNLNEVTYLKSETKKDAALEKVFAKEFGLTKGTDSIRYYYNKLDLNNDQINETFVYLVGPMVCGTGGCSGLLLEEKDGGYTVKSRFSLVRTPVIIQNETTNGWKNIVMYVAGGGIEPGYHQLKFDGENYPSNPSVQPIVEEDKIIGIGIINDEIAEDTGIVF
ncbi:hypothetical protein GLW07_16175 [Bacillus hwajinpoensis]|uniref:Uncharacterized protein n=1 Tax=Guptibacillus hwajinpoensis TaxID=208199 RepID=A0A845F2K9_9BACL|nr:hypothetical protein [Pseudalkalibacillus hwajinpoensis]MYL64897.1 hypothetical protein [Pseudalkalibacillus hwajinpoensis]